MKLTKEELQRAGWNSNEERSAALHKIAKDLAKYIIDTSPALRMPKQNLNEREIR